MVDMPQLSMHPAPMRVYPELAAIKVSLVLYKTISKTDVSV